MTRPDPTQFLTAFAREFPAVGRAIMELGEQYGDTMMLIRLAQRDLDTSPADAQALGLCVDDILCQAEDGAAYVIKPNGQTRRLC